MMCLLHMALQLNFFQYIMESPAKTLLRAPVGLLPSVDAPVDRHL